MGFNTAVILLNDYMHEIAEDPKFGDKIVDAARLARRDTKQYHSGFDVLPSEHADTIQIVAIGCNSIRALGYAHWQDDDHTLLKKLADQMGYRIVRKRKDAI